MYFEEISLDKFERAVEENKNILAAMYTGSTGKGVNDRFSDLDIELIVTKKFLKKSNKNIESLLRLIGVIKIIYSLDERNFKCLINDNYMKIDFKLHTKEALIPREKYKQVRVIKDAKNILKEFIRKSRKCRTKANEKYIENMFKEALMTQIVVANRCARGWMWSAVEWINFRLQQLVIDLLKIRGKLQFCFANVENLLDKKEIKMLSEVYCKRPSKNEIKKSLRALWKFTKFVYGEYEKKRNKKIMKVKEKEFLKHIDSILAMKQKKKKQ